MDLALSFRPRKVRTLSVASALVACLLISGSPAKAEEPQTGEVGGPPTIALGPLDEGKRTTPDIVIARGRDYEGAVELVAYGLELSGYGGPPQRGVCIWAAYIPRDQINFQGCVLTEESRAGGALEITTSGGQLNPPSERYSQFGGRISPDVSAIRVKFQRPHRTELFRVKPIIALVDGDLQEKLKMPEAFGFFTVRVAGLVPRRMFRVQVFRGGSSRAAH